MRKAPTTIFVSVYTGRLYVADAGRHQPRHGSSVKEVRIVGLYFKEAYGYCKGNLAELSRSSSEEVQ